MCKGPEVGVCFMHLWMTRGSGRKGGKAGPLVGVRLLRVLGRTWILSVMGKLWGVGGLKGGRFDLHSRKIPLAVGR